MNEKSGFIGPYIYGIMLLKRKDMLLILLFIFSQMIKGNLLYGQNVSRYVDPFIGTANQEVNKVNWKNGETFPGAVVPWGMVSVSPHNRLGSKSGYIHGEPYFYGFGHVHLSGVGCSDLGSVVLMPTIGEIKTNPRSYKSEYGDEEASAGYYKTVLQPSGIVAEASATIHTGITKYAFTSTKGAANVLLDASVTENQKWMPAPGYVKLVSNHEVEGWTESGHFCGAPQQVQRVYFVAMVSRDADSAGTWFGNRVTSEKEQSGKGVGAYFRFTSSPKKPVYVRVGISYVSITNARLNLKKEQPGWDFKGVRNNAKKEWNHYLSRIRVSGGTKSEKVIFYTGLYHMLIHPSVFSDVNGDYMTMGHLGSAKDNRHVHYDVYSLWDTYRNEHVFLTLFYPRKEHDMVASLLAMYKESGWLPKWELAGNDARVMVGDPAGNVLVETWANGIHDFDTAAAFRAMLHNAEDTSGNPVRKALKEYLRLHYIPSGIRGSVSMTLEYSMADHSIAEMAKITGHYKEYETFNRRAGYYKNLYDSVTGFLRPKRVDGNWYCPFDPEQFKGKGFIEGSAWNYLFYVPFDEKGLAELLGGKQKYVAKLQKVFDENNYAAYNEPDISYPYLFTYFKGEEWRTQKEVRSIMQKSYSSAPGGLPGNDDCGALSAWYVFSALGFYPANPVSGNFRLGSPVFKKVVLRTDPKYYSGKRFIIKTKRASGGAVFVESVRLNGRPYKKPFITHNVIEAGGKIKFFMTIKHEQK